MRNTSECVILAADGLDLPQVLDLVDEIGDRLYAVKIHSLWDRHGPGVVRQLLDAGAPRIWVDLKLHDIPETVRDRAKAVAESGAHLVTVHASGGIEMMMAACESGIDVIAVTVLTSLEEDEVHLLHGHPSKAEVLALTRLARMAGVPSVVCSPREVGILAKRPELKGMNFITPGVRSLGVAVDDQKRVDTPANAIKAGATRLVIGRQITRADSPLAALEPIELEINA